jgi:hypothetical protein
MTKFEKLPAFVANGLIAEFENGDIKLSAWEIDFLESISDQNPDFLSLKQTDIFKRMFDSKNTKYTLADLGSSATVELKSDS